MCGIVLSADPSIVQPAERRGPNEATVIQMLLSHQAYTLMFDRLKVYGGDHGKQPFALRGPDGSDVYSVTNGEVYNHRRLREQVEEAFVPYNDSSARRGVLGDVTVNGAVDRDAEVGNAAMVRFISQYYDGRPGGDCGVIPYLVLLFGLERAFDMIHGEFASVMVAEGNIILARDKFGVRPLYYGHDAQNNLVVVSTPDCIKDPAAVPDLRQFPPGKVMVWCPHYQREVWYSITPPTKPMLPGDTLRRRVVRCFYDACSMRCYQNDDRMVTVLLSGGMDSSVVLAMACHLLGNKRVRAITGHLEGAETSDVKHARQLCEELQVQHHVVAFDPIDIATLRKVITAIGTWDTTSVRASAAQMLMLQKALRVHGRTGNVVLSGEGADEVGQGYQNFKLSATAAAAHRESARLLSKIHFYDGLRADRTVSHFGLELRLPFLDTAFVDALFEIDEHERWCGNAVEKRYLRELIATDLAEMVPELRHAVAQKILQRPKEALSDSVGDAHRRQLQQLAEEHVPASWLANGAFRWPHCPPKNKEEYLYRMLYDERYAGVTDIPEYWDFRFVGEANHHGDPSATQYPFYTKG
jgi:asparagine synthase (glutamine-hydrolysing)